jgi:hypothetical protein
MKIAILTLALALLVGCAVVPVGPDGAYGPPPVAFRGAPDVVVMPDTDDVYVVPDLDVDVYFWSGWWWRPWGGRWYRSRYYDRGWAYYDRIPSFYRDVDPDWRGYYRNHNWYGHRWDYERIPHGRLQQNWNGWYKNRYWQNQRSWGVQGYQPRSRGQQPQPPGRGQEPQGSQPRRPEGQQPRGQE